MQRRWSLLIVAEDQFDLDVAVEEMDGLLESGSADDALAYLADLHPADQAALVAELPPERRVLLLPRIPREALADIIGFLEEEPRRAVVLALDPSLLGPLLDNVERDVAVDVLHELPPEHARTTLANMRTASEVMPLLPFEDESAGGRATSGFVALHRAWSVQQSIEYLRRHGPSAEQAFYLYVVDDAHHLEGVVSLRQLVVAQPEQHIEELMTPEVMAVRAETDQEEALRQIQHYNFVALPVVDEERHLVGVVSVDDLLDVAEEEATEDMYRMAGLDEDESFLRPIARSVTPRLSWLLLNLATAFGAAAMVATFEGTIERAAALAVFMPIIAGMGGNAGIQTITLTVRSLALGDVDVDDAFHIMRRELAIGIVNGVVIGLLLGVLSYLWKDNVGLSVVAGTAMLLNMATAVTVGVLVPITLRAAKLDPALAAGVIVTTFTDILGFFFFLGLATLMIDRIA